MRCLKQVLEWVIGLQTLFNFGGLTNYLCAAVAAGTLNVAMPNKLYDMPAFDSVSHSLFLDIEPDDNRFDMV